MPVVTERDVEYRDGLALLRGRLYFRADHDGTRPAVLVLPAYRGPQGNEERHARMLAEAGYAAFVVDVYGRRSERHGRLWHFIRCVWYQLNFRIYQRRVWAAFDALCQQPEADSSRLGMIGFCAGGVGVLIMLSSMPEIRAAGIFHMGPSRLAPPERGSSQASCLICHGGRDSVASLDFVKRLVGRWYVAGMRMHLEVYPEAGHAFTDSELHQSERMGHHPDSAGKAWQALLEHFGKQLQKAGPQQVQPAVDQAAQRRRFDIALFHGMGLQNRYMTLDELVNFLIFSLCENPREVLFGNKSVLIPELHTQRRRGDRQVHLKLEREQLHPLVAARLGNHQELVINASEVYWAPIASGTARARRTIMWLIGGLSSIVKALVTMPLSRQPEDRHRDRCRRDDYGQLESISDVWRLSWLLLRLAMVIVVLPLLVMGLSALVVGWLAVWVVHLGYILPAVEGMRDWLTGNWPGLRALIAEPALLSGAPLLDWRAWLGILATLLPLLLNHVGSSVLANSVNTPLSRQDLQRPAARSADWYWFMLMYLTFGVLAYFMIAGGCRNHWTQLQACLATVEIPSGFPALRVWAWAAISLPLASLLALVGMMGWRLLKNEAGLPRMLGYGCGLLAISLALRGDLAFGREAATLSLLLILLVTWVSLIRRGLLFIREYLGDVAAFVSTDENDRMFALRTRILQLSEENLERFFGYDLAPNSANAAHQHSEIERQQGQDLIVMAHSLGTVVAYQALCRYFERLHEIDKLQLDADKAGTHGNRWMTRELQRRLRLFVTFGCPLDTINMSFNALHSGKPVFDRVVSQALYRHGCAGPFKQCRWLNWWHRGDVVSAKVLWQAGDKGPVNRQLPLGAAPVVNHSAYLLAQSVQEDFRREFARLL
ncbi:MAG: dienelactone hydrolase family protein [bacterium]